MPPMIYFFALCAAQSPQVKIIGAEGLSSSGEQTTLTFQLEPTQKAEDRPLQVAVSTGQLIGLTRVAHGEYSAVFTAPSSDRPEIAVFSFWYETGDQAEVAFKRVELSGRALVKVSSYPGAEVRVEAGALRFGPVTANQRGIASVPIAAPPGVQQAIAVIDGRRSPLSLVMHTYNRLALVVVPYRVAPNGRAHATVHAYYDQTGHAIPAGPSEQIIQLTASQGSVRFRSKNAEQNHFWFDFQADNLIPGSVQMRALVPGDPVSMAETALVVGRASPTRMRAQVIEPPKDAGRAKLEVLVTDARGLGVAGVPLTASPSAGQVDAIQDEGDGKYSVQFIPPTSRPSEGVVFVGFQTPLGSKPSASLEMDMDTGSGDQNAVSYERSHTNGQGNADNVSLGMSLGASLDGYVDPLVRVDLAVRLVHRLDAYIDGSLGMLSQNLVNAQTNFSSDSKFLHIPVLAGLKFNFLEYENWQIYGRGGAGINIMSRTHTRAFPEATLTHQVGPAAEIMGGFSRAGVFLELGALVAPAATVGPSASPNTVGLVASLGYRLVLTD